MQAQEAQDRALKEVRMRRNLQQLLIPETLPQLLIPGTLFEILRAVFSGGGRERGREEGEFSIERSRFSIE